MKNTELFNELSESISIRIFSCLEISHGSDWIENKVHNDYDLWYIQSGQVIVSWGETVHTVNAGDWVFFYPKRSYTASTGKEGCRFIYTHFEFGIGDQFRILEDFPLNGIIPGKPIEEEAFLFRQAFQSNRNEAGMSRMRLKGCLTLVIAKILEMYDEGNYTGVLVRSEDSTKREQTRSLDALQQVFAYIHDNLHRQLPIPELANLADMSEKYFITYFKKALGVTPGQYMYRLRMNKARDYLYDPRAYSIQEIAALLGYVDPYTFSKAFKKYYKIAPSLFV